MEYLRLLLEYWRANYQIYFFAGHLKNKNHLLIIYSESLNNEYIERIHQMSYSSLSDNGMLQIFIFLIK